MPASTDYWINDRAMCRRKKNIGGAAAL